MKRVPTTLKHGIEKRTKGKREAVTKQSTNHNAQVKIGVGKSTCTVLHVHVRARVHVRMCVGR